MNEDKMEYSLAEVSDMITELGIAPENTAIGVVMFSTAFLGTNRKVLKEFTGFDSEVDETLDHMDELGMIDEESGRVIAEWTDKTVSAISFTLDVLAVLGYFLVSYNESGERAYTSNPAKPHPYFKTLDGLLP